MSVTTSLPCHSDNVEEEQRRVTIALESVFSSSTTAPDVQHDTDIDNALRRRDLADRYLTSFQRCPVAWMVCDRLLIQDTSPNASPQETAVAAQRRFFAAQTLHFKCREEVFIHQIPGDSLPSLRDSLVSHLTKFALGGVAGSRPLLTRLCMAIAALAVQMRWNTVIPDVLENLYKPRPELCGAVLELFQVLPEETCSDRLFVTDESVRFDFRESLRNCSDAILAFLWHCFTGASQTEASSTASDSTMQRDVFLCFTSWLRNVDIPPVLLQQSPLLEAAFAATSHASNISNTDDALFETAIDVIVEALRAYGSAPTCNAGLVTKIIPLVMSLGQQPFQKALHDEDEDALRGYCRIFTEMGESYMELIMDHQEMNQSALVELVLQCSAIPDNEIANITLHFWYRFVNSLEDLEPYAFRQHRIDYYTPILTRLLQICTVLMRYPPDILDLRPDHIDDIERDRYYVSDTVEDCCRLLGGDVVLNNLGARLKQEYDIYANTSTDIPLTEKWQAMESCLFAIKSIARYVPVDENTYLPFVMELIYRRLLPQEIPLLRYTANLAVGRYAAWLGAHPTFLPHLLPYLAEGLVIRESAYASALAIKELCEGCWNQPLGDPVLQLYENLVRSREEVSAVTDLKDELEVLEGVCKAMSRQLQRTNNTSPEIVSSCLTRIVAPIGTRLTNLVAPENNHTNSRLVIAEIERLTVIIRFLELPPTSSTAEPYNKTVFLEIMQRSWSLLDNISLKFPNDTNLAEKLCRLHKHALRKCGADVYAPLLQSLMLQLVRNFNASHQSPYLYLASICITEYGRKEAYVPKLFEMISQLCNAVFEMLKTLEHFVAHPDVIEEFFYLVGRFMNYCPEPLVVSPLLPSLLQCAAVGMHVQHRDANRGTLNFLEHTVSYGLHFFDPEPHFMRSNSSTHEHDFDDDDEPIHDQNAVANGVLNQQLTACKEAFYRAVVGEGQAIVSNLARAILGELPAYSIDRGSGSIAGILWKLNVLIPDLLVQWMTSALESAPQSKSKVDFLSALVQKASRDEFNAVLSKFCTVCERNRKLQENAM